MTFVPSKINKIMESLRFKAIDNLTSTKEGVKVESPAKITAIFGESVFTLKTAREFLSDDAYKSLANSIKSGRLRDKFFSRSKRQIPSA